jgi:peptidoglycan/LPS O-acetylase OafA/YrhL
VKYSDSAFSDGQQLSSAKPLLTARPPLPMLTSLRFFAAAEVVIYHFTFSIPSGPFTGWMKGGYEAVTFFFVLSGFILTYVYSGTDDNQPMTSSSGAFLQARLARLAPAYAVGLALAFPSFIYSTLISHIHSLDFFILSILMVPLFLQSWYPPLALAWNAPAWSLSVEWFFYALFPILMRYTMRLFRFRSLVAAYCIVLIVSLARSGLALEFKASTDPLSWTNFINCFPPFHLPQFIFGIALGKAFLFGVKLRPRTYTLLLAGGSIGLFVVFGLHWILPWWTRIDAVLVILFGAVIFGSAASEGSISRVLTSRPFILLGEASYAMYIMHIPIFFWWTEIGERVLKVKLPLAIDFVVYFGITIGFSIFSFLYIEIPLRRRLLRRREHQMAY